MSREDYSFQPIDPKDYNNKFNILTGLLCPMKPEDLTFRQYSFYVGIQCVDYFYYVKGSFPGEVIGRGSIISLHCGSNILLAAHAATEIQNIILGHMRSGYDLTAKQIRTIAPSDDNTDKLFYKSKQLLQWYGLVRFLELKR